MTQSFTIPDTISEEYIRNLNWREFELFVSELLKWNGYYAKVTPASNDEGKDIIATKNGDHYYIECKHWSKHYKVGREYLEKLVGAAARDGVKNIIFITTSAFHKNAYDYRDDLNIQGNFNLLLLDTKSLIRLSKHHKENNINNLSTTRNTPIITPFTKKDLKLGDLSWHDPKEKVLKVLGSPISIKKNFPPLWSGNVEDLKFDNNNIEVITVNDSLMLMIVKLPNNMATPRGIYCGMTAQDIIDAYGQPSFSHNGKNSTMDTSIVYEVEDRIDLIFDLLNNKITCIRFGEFD